MSDVFPVSVNCRMMSVGFATSKQAAAAMSTIREMRSDLVVESLKPSETISMMLLHF